MKKVISTLALAAICSLWLAHKSDQQFLPKSIFPTYKSSQHEETMSKLLGGSDTQKTEEPTSTHWKDVLTTVKDLQHKVIRTPEDTQRLIDIYSSKENINKAVADIKHLDDKDLLKNQKSRMDAVFFFLRGLEVKNNPAKDYIESQISELVLDPSVEHIENIDLKKSVVADRIELFVAIKEKNPALGFELQTQATSNFQKRILNFAINFYNLEK